MHQVAIMPSTVCCQSVNNLFPCIKLPSCHQQSVVNLSTTCFHYVYNLFHAPTMSAGGSKNLYLKPSMFPQVIGGAQGVADKIVGNQPKESTYSQSGGPWNWLFPRTKQAVKNVLPDLSELPAAATNTDNRDNRNLGPNEVGKDLLGGLPNASKADTAAPGVWRLSRCVD
jgi:hypothetical protein